MQRTLVKKRYAHIKAIEMTGVTKYSGTDQDVPEQ
jgi:hypothetical protein